MSSTKHEACPQPTSQRDDAASLGRVEWARHCEARRRGVAVGSAASVLLALVYVVVLSLANSLEHASSEFLLLWYWMLPLLVGFGAQVGLFTYGRRVALAGAMPHAHGVAASSGTNVVSMVACCAHHLADVLPLLGLAGAATVLATYQDIFLLLGVVSNLVGLVYVLGHLKRHGLFPTRRSVLSTAVAWPVEHALPCLLTTRKDAPWRPGKKPT